MNKYEMDWILKQSEKKTKQNMARRLFDMTNIICIYYR